MVSWQVDAILDAVESSTAYLPSVLSTRHKNILSELLQVIEVNVRAVETTRDQTSRANELENRIRNALDMGRESEIVIPGGANSDMNGSGTNNSASVSGIPRSTSSTSASSARVQTETNLPFRVNTGITVADKRRQLFAEWERQQESGSLQHEEAAAIHQRRKAQEKLGLREEGQTAQQMDDSTADELLEATDIIKRLTQDLHENMQVDKKVLEGLAEKQNDALDRVTQEEKKAAALLKMNSLGFWTQMLMFISALGVFAFMCFFIMATHWTKWVPTGWFTSLF